MNQKKWGEGSIDQECPSTLHKGHSVSSNLKLGGPTRSGKFLKLDPQKRVLHYKNLY